MAKLGVSLPRPVRRTMLVSALIAGAFTAFAPSAPSAHAAGPCATGYRPADITTVNNSTIVGGVGSIIVTVAGGQVKFTANTAGAGLPTVTQLSPFACQTTDVTLTPGTGDNGTITGATYPTMSGPLNAGTCSFNGAFFSSSATDGSDTLNVLLKCQGGSITTITVDGKSGQAIFSSGSGGTNTPELGSGELLATGLVPALGIFLYRRRRQQRANK